MDNCNGTDKVVSGGVTLSWSNLTVYIKQKDNTLIGSKYHHKRIVNNASGAVKAGTLVALMGPSGSGKSTMMYALGHRYQESLLVDGDIRVNGLKVNSSMCHLSGFMYQEDVFIGALTVAEHLMFQAHLRMDRRTKTRDKIRRISELVDRLSLNSCLHTRIGGFGIDSEKMVISGGERKRLSFATECLCDPPLLLTDEPTTGLDSFSAQTLVRMMQDMAKTNGKTILTTIHQPSPEILALFDSIILLAEGSLVFTGTPEDAISFFTLHGYQMTEHCSPGEFLIKNLAPTPGSEMATVAAVKRLSHQFALTEDAKHLDMVIQYEHCLAKDCDEVVRRLNFKSEFWLIKLFWISYRSLLEVVRNPNVQWIRMFQKLIIALVIGLCYWGTIRLTQSGVQAAQGVLFLLCTENTFAPMYAALEIIPATFPLFIREHKNDVLSPSIFYLATVLSRIPGLFLEAFVFTTTVYLSSGLNLAFDAYLITILVTILCINVSSACGTMFSTIFESPTSAMAYLIPFDYVVMITSGLFIKLSSLPPLTSWLRYLSWFMYSYESMTIVQWADVQNITCADEPYLPCANSGHQVLENFGFSSDHLYINMLALLGLYFGFHLIGFVFFLRRVQTRL